MMQRVQARGRATHDTRAMEGCRMERAIRDMMELGGCRMERVIRDKRAMEMGEGCRMGKVIRDMMGMGVASCWVRVPPRVRRRGMERTTP
jgi:hypothetical protein